MTNFLNKEEIRELGFKSVGNDVFISRKASFYSPEKISIGEHVRIDDFCVLSGNIQIGNYVHIAVYSGIFGGEKGVKISDFCNISSRVSIYALSDDYSGESMTNPMIPDEYKNVEQREVVLEKHVLLGCGSIVLPGAYLSEGASFGAFSLVKTKVEPWTMNAGIPCRKIKERSKNILDLERKFMDNQKGEKDV